MNELLQRMYDFTPRVAVCGDAMVDEYYEVKADKVSPEFPIPVLHSPTGKPTEAALGGAANVCAQFEHFNFDLSLFALTNERVKWMGKQKGINMDGCIFSRYVPVKKRYYSEGFPLCRIDEEARDYQLDPSLLRKLQDKILDNLFSGSHDVVVFSNYDKGIFSGLSDFISRSGDAITIVDPKCGPLDRWRGCTIFKPNAKEARDMTGIEDPEGQCEFLMDRLGCQAVVITQGGAAVVGNVQGAPFEYRPKSPTTPRSVIGAGDCFVAFLAMCMCHSIDIRRAVGIAFEACSLYVQQPYNRPIYPYQMEPSKFVDPRNLIDRDFSLSFANGFWDILHPGHVELLKFAKSKADKLVVALNSDESAIRLGKSHPLINPLDYRKSMIESLSCVDFVVDFDEDTPINLIKTIKPDVLVKGADWKNPVGSEIVPEVHSFELVGSYSTSSIIKKIREIV